MTTRKIKLISGDPPPDVFADAGVRWTTDKFEATHAIINGVLYKKSPGGHWAPDYSHPDTAEAVRKSVDEAVEAHWSIDRWRK